jgi:hypothetical protein
VETYVDVGFCKIDIIVLGVTVLNGKVANLSGAR